VPVLCPPSLPGGGWTVEHRTLRQGRCEYLIDLIRAARTGPYHALIGGRCGAFPLRVVDGEWPAAARLPRDLGLVGSLPLEPGQRVAPPVRLRVLRRVEVDGEPGLLVRAREFPAGGVHGGHVGVVWNRGGSGYTLTIHRARPVAVLRAARAISSSP
jgi:hypothetical protein